MSSKLSGEWVTRRQLAELLGITTRTIDRRVAAGVFRTLLVGNRRRIHLGHALRVLGDTEFGVSENAV